MILFPGMKKKGVEAGGARLGESAQSRGQAMRYAHLELRRELSVPISQIDDIRGGGFKDKRG